MRALTPILIALLCGAAPMSPPLDLTVPIHVHWTIGRARAVLIGNGWKPVRQPRYPTDRDYPEREQFCASGKPNLTLCMFNYIKAGRCLQVETVGETTRRVEWWTHRCPLT